MDSLTQIVLGAALAAAIAPPRHRRAALAAGAALGTLPDLDSLPLVLLSDDPIVRMTWHRSASHSLLVLPLVAWAIWAWCRGRGGRVAASPTRWWWAILLALVTHPLLDAFTVYGTQLWWPLQPKPAMWSSVFIIDPLYTVWLLLACVAAHVLRERHAAQWALVAGLALSTAYLGWSLLAKARADRDAATALAAMGLQDAPRFSVPAGPTTQRWRVVAMTPGGYVEGDRTLADTGPMAFTARASDVAALRAVQALPSVRRLAWFNHGFMGAEVRDGQLVLSDLRMGRAPDYAFRFAVAEWRDGGWHAIPPVNANRRQVRQALRVLWKRLRGERDQAAADNPGATPAASASK